METYYTSKNGFSKTIITVCNQQDIFEVVNTLKFISKLLCLKLDYDVNLDEKEISVAVEDYYEFKTLQRKLNYHCNIGD